MALYAEERQQEIAEQARREGRVEVNALAAEYGITPETIRRDLKSLERQGILRRVHGGGIPIERFQSEPAVAEKAGHMAEEKQRIAAAAIALIPRSGSIYLDAGTTTQALAELIPNDRDLTVITNCVPVAMTLSTRSRLNVLLVGGRVRGRTLATVDDWATRIVSELRVDVAFVATNGFSLEHGLTTPDVAEAAVKRAVVASGRQVVLLADHTKIGEERMVKFADTSQIDVLVTDVGIDSETDRALSANGTEVIKA